MTNSPSDSVRSLETIANYNPEFLPDWVRSTARNAADEIERLTAALSAERARAEEAEKRHVWHDGPPPKPWCNEWFIAETIYGDRVVLTALPDENNYDFKTADETYMTAVNVRRWTQFPDSQYITPQDQCVAQLKSERDALREAVEKAEKKVGLLQATITAWSGAVGSLAAHIRDRIAMKDPAQPDVYLSILESEIGGLERDAGRIYAASQARADRSEARALAAEKELAQLKDTNPFAEWFGERELRIAAESERDALREALEDISEFSSEDGTTLGALRRLADIRARAMAAIRTRTEGGENGR